MSCQHFSAATITDYDLGLLDGPAAQGVSQHVRTCPECRGLLSDVAALRRDLQSPAPQIDLVPQLRAALWARPEPQPVRPWRRWLMGAVPAVGVALALLAVWPAAAPQPTEATVRAKASADPGAQAIAWVGVTPYRVGRDGSVTYLGETMTPDDALVLTYSNAGNAPYSHLMVFGVDAAGSVHWYYPAYEAAGTDPEAIPIAAGVVSVQLPDRIQQRLARGPLVLHALFAREALKVSQVEQALTGADRATSLRLPGTQEQRFFTHVVEAVP